MCDVSLLDNLVLGNSWLHCNKYACFKLLSMFYLYQFKCVCMYVSMYGIYYILLFLN